MSVKITEHVFELLAAPRERGVRRGYILVQRAALESLAAENVLLEQRVKELESRVEYLQAIEGRKYGGSGE